MGTAGLRRVRGAHRRGHRGDGHKLPGDCVADQQALGVEAHPLWLVETSELVLNATREVADEHSIIAGVGDRKPVPAVGGDLAREGERRVASKGNRREGRPDGEIVAAVEELCDHAGERGSVALA